MDTSPPRAALVQMTSGIDPEVNLATMDTALAEAAAGGAVMAFFPEMSLLLDRDRGRSAAHIVREADSPWPARLQEMARRHGLWIHSGSMPLLAEDGARRVNRRSEKHTSELQSLMRTSYAVFCLKKNKIHHKTSLNTNNFQRLI